jgi:hypothetical protein
METVYKNYQRVKGNMFYAAARCHAEHIENPNWEEEYEPYKPVKKRGGLGGAISANVKEMEQEYSQNLNMAKGVTVRQMMTIDPRQKPVLDVARVRKDLTWVEAVLKAREERAIDAARTPDPSVVSLGSDAGKMVRTRITRRNMAQIGRSALQRRMLERPEMDVEDSEDDKGAEWDPYADESSSEEDTPPPKVLTYGDVIMWGFEDDPM